MKILIVNDQHYPLVNGVAWFARTLAMGLAGRGHDVRVIAPSMTGSPRQKIEQDENYQIYRLPSVTVPFYRAARLSLYPDPAVKKIIRDFQPDVIHIQSPLTIGQLAMKYGRKLRIPIVSTSHQMSENLLEQIKILAPISRPLAKIITNYGARFHSGADVITIPTQAAADMFASTVEKKISREVLAVSNGVDLSQFAPPSAKTAAQDQATLKKYLIPLDKKFVLYVGRVDADKHLSVIVRAFATLPSTVDARLVIVGTGNDSDNLKQLAKKLRISRHVIFTGFVSEDEKASLDRSATLFAMPSPVELQSIASLEAMASGQPIVAVDAGALYELCHNDENGFLVATDDDAAFATAFETILTDEKVRQKFSHESIRIAKTHDVKYTLDRFEQIYGEAIAAKKAEQPTMD
jgi:glycosyltransferase involved in cell wall biosynthesis